MNRTCPYLSGASSLLELGAFEEGGRGLTPGGRALPCGQQKFRVGRGRPEGRDAEQSECVTDVWFGCTYGQRRGF